MSVEYQKTLGYKCSELIGWNCVQRRNIALLEALKWGAELIITIDDDNIPLNKTYFADFQRVLLRMTSNERNDVVYKATEFNGLQATSNSGWFDVGTLLNPVAPHRGFPHEKASQPVFDSITDAKVGLAAGICLGDPDISAVTRIANGPIVHGVSALLQEGIVTDPRVTKTVYNTQNTAFIRELAPAMFCPPGWGRYDDILASLVTQRVMAERGLHVHFGKPFVWQQRNAHNLNRDLEIELWGMKHIVEFADHLWEHAKISQYSTVLDRVRAIYTGLPDHLVPNNTRDTALAFLDDCDGVL